VHKVVVSDMPATVADLDPRGRCVVVLPLKPVESPSSSARARTDGSLSLTRCRYLAVGSNDTLVSLWETTDWTCAATSGMHECVDALSLVLGFRFLSSRRAPQLMV